MNLIKICRNATLIIGFVLLTFGMCGLDTEGNGYKCVVVICMMGVAFLIMGVIITRLFQIDDD